MDYDDTPDEADFRARLRLWLAEHPVVIADDADDTARARLHADWHRALYEGGWVGLSWPVDYGGQGLGPVFEAIANDEVGRAGAPAMPHVGYLGRGILAHGTEEQKRRFLPGLLSGREVWCQGFSEPGAGSDLAALCTRAERTEAGWVVDGQKVWTSDAWIADWCLALVRTDPEAPRHRGISALAIRMDSPGVEVRPLVLSNGDRDFCEVFFDDVVVPTDQLVGEPGQGWALAMGTLGYERGPSDIGFSSRYQALLVSLEREARARSVPPDDEQRRALARAYVSTEVLRLHVLRSLSRRVAGAEPGPEGSVDKLLATRTEQDLHHLAMDLAGVDPLVGRAPARLREYLYSRAQSIAGGTSQIQRTIVAERVLGLPRGR